MNFTDNPFAVVRPDAPFSDYTIGGTNSFMGGLKKKFRDAIAITETVPEGPAYLDTRAEALSELDPSRPPDSYIDDETAARWEARLGKLRERAESGEVFTGPVPAEPEKSWLDKGKSWLDKGKDWFHDSGLKEDLQEGLDDYVSDTEKTAADMMDFNKRGAEPVDLRHLSRGLGSINFAKVPRQGFLTVTPPRKVSPGQPYDMLRTDYGFDQTQKMLPTEQKRKMRARGR